MEKIVITTGLKRPGHLKKKTHDKIQWTSNHSWTFAIENVCVSQALRVF